MQFKKNCQHKDHHFVKRSPNSIENVVESSPKVTNTTGMLLLW